MNDLENRKKVAIANTCRMYLYYNGFITEKQNEQTNKKIKKFQEKKNEAISMEQLSSVDYVYNDNAKDYYDCNIICHEANYDWGNDYNFIEIHGYASGRVYTIKEEVDNAYIEGLHVSEDERGNGHGSDMMSKLIDKCKEIGAKKITLWCEKNKWVHLWYKRLGFNDDGDKEDQEGFVWMVKELQINEE